MTCLVNSPRPWRRSPSIALPKLIARVYNLHGITLWLFRNALIAHSAT